MSLKFFNQVNRKNLFVSGPRVAKNFDTRAAGKKNYKNFDSSFSLPKL